MVKVVEFFKEVIEETKKLEFPSKKETYTVTTIVIVATAISSFAVVMTDFFVSGLMKLLLGFGS